jgi:hypothetical protein
MKLRIKGNSIRFRLTQTEIDTIAKKPEEEKTDFPGGVSISYKIQKGNTLAAAFLNGAISITVPSNIIDDWVTTDKVSIDCSVGLNKGDTLHILLEKDFKCLTGRPQEDETDMFPNPLEIHSKC